MIRLTQALERLVANCGGEAWCRKIHEEKPETLELYRDEKRGFVLLAHTERKGLYRPPHARFFKLPARGGGGQAAELSVGWRPYETVRTPGSKGIRLAPRGGKARWSALFCMRTDDRANQSIKRPW